MVSGCNFVSGYYSLELETPAPVTVLISGFFEKLQAKMSREKCCGSLTRAKLGDLFRRVPSVLSNVNDAKFDDE